MASVKAVLRTDKKPNGDGEYLLVLRLIHKRKTKYPYSFGITLTEEEWNEATQSIRATHRLYQKMNTIIKKKLQQADEIVTLALMENKNLSAKRLRNRVAEQMTGDTYDFIKYAEEFYKNLYAEKRTRYANKMKYTIRKLKEYCGGELPFDELKVSNGAIKFLKKYRRYLKIEKNNAPNTIHGNFKNMKTIVKEAIVDGYLPQNENPFFTFSVEKEETHKTHLSLKQILAIESLELDPYSTMGLTRNSFLFSFYMAGIRFSDMIQLVWMEEKEDNILDYTMNKTRGSSGSRRILPIPPPAQEILNLYRKKVKGVYDYIFPWLDPKQFPSIKDHKYTAEQLKLLVKQCSSKTTLSNKYLKKIARRAGIRENVTNHVARHTFTGIAEDLGLSVKEMQSLLGHSSISTTEIYRDSFTKTRDAAAMNKFWDKLEQAKQEIANG